jgi:hypothetical protein
MSVLRSYQTHCPSCGWQGDVSVGDVRSGPWRKADGSLFYKELICPRCEEQMTSPFAEPSWGEPAVLSPEEEKALKERERAMRQMGMSLRPRQKEK